MKTDIQIATTETQVTACYPVMAELRPDLKEEQFLNRIQRQQADGYRLAFMEQDDTVVAVAGFRIGENLAWGRFLYVDDLVTRADCRSNGYGTQLLDWMKDHAKEQGCDQLHLDSGLQRVDAHRFYVREGLPKTSFHFSAVI